MKHKDYEIIVQNILQLIDEGVHVVDNNYKSIIYNDSMANLEKMNVRDVLNKPFMDVFKNMDENDSTILRALHENESTIQKVQTYSNKDGKEITTINTTVPISNKDGVFASIEISKNITDIKLMTNTISELREEIGQPIKIKKSKINKYKFINLISVDEEFRKIIEISKKASRNDASVFIYGETGTGKELIAQSIHYDGTRRDKPFIAQNCAALPESLLEGILFGTEKGGFTGAIDRKGLFEQATGGTLLLDEINSLTYNLQAKLLRVLQENYIRRVGGIKDIPVDVRIIATTNEKPQKLIQEGRLRKDLYYRLNIIPIELPPLRDRKEDILILAETFIEKYKKNENCIISQKAKKKLLTYDYPGNVRELENIIRAAIAMIDDEEIITDKEILIIHNKNKMKLHQYEEEGLNKYISKVERNIIEDALRKNNNNISKTANYLKIKRQTLQHKLKKISSNIKE